MRYSKTIEVAGKIFKEQDLKRLSEIILQNFSEEETTFKAIFDDNSSISSSKFDIFDSSYIKRKKAITIELSAYDGRNSVNFNINCFNSNNNYIFISSFDEKWYDAFISKITEFIGEIENQKWLYHLNNFMPSLLIGLVFTVIVSALFTLAINTYISNHNIELSNKVSSIITFILVVINWALCMLMGHFLSSAYPSVEFAFGPEFKNSGKRVRHAWNYIGTVFVIPFLFWLLSKML